MNDYLKYLDKFTFIVIIIISLSGILLIYSVSQSLEQSYYLKQLLWLSISLIAFFIVLRIKTEFVFRYSLALYIILCIILSIQLIAGRIVGGTKSWLKFGFVGIQVSEFIKIPIALYIANILSKIRIINWFTFCKLISLLGIPFLLIAVQPDLGTAFILASFIIISILLKRIKLSIIFVSIIFIIIGSFLSWNYILKPYQKNRITSFFNPEKYSQSSGYQIIQSKIAIGSGGLNGKGYLKGSQSKYKFLPTSHTDFVVSVLGEEFGFIGVSFLFLLFFILFYRQFNFKSKTDREFYFVYLFNFFILFQFLINISMSIGLFPILGIPLPFVSYGGSSLLSFFIGEAIIFKIKINNYLEI